MGIVELFMGLVAILGGALAFVWQLFRRKAAEAKRNKERAEQAERMVQRAQEVQNVRANVDSLDDPATRDRLRKWTRDDG